MNIRDYRKLPNETKAIIEAIGDLRGTIGLGLLLLILSNIISINITGCIP